MQRINWIDYAKVFGMFLVVLGHSSIPTSSVNFIYAFHMPLFFFISGYLFNISRFVSFKEFFTHRLKQLMIPYFFFNVLTFVFWYFVGRKFGNDSSEEISPLTPIVGMFYGVDTGNYLIHCGSLWFLPCLFLVEIMYYWLIKKIRLALLIALIPIIAYLNLSAHHFMLPFSFDVACVALFFYAVGNGGKTYLNQVLASHRVVTLGLMFVFLVALFLISDLNGRSDMSSNTYPNFLFFLMGALSGIGFTIFSSNSISQILGEQKWIIYFSKNTLLILALHGITGSILKGVLHFLFKIPLQSFDHALVLNIALALLNFLVSIPAIFILERYLPLAIGRPVNKTIA